VVTGVKERYVVLGSSAPRQQPQPRQLPWNRRL